MYSAPTPGSMLPPQTPGFAPETPGMGNYNPSTPMGLGMNMYDYTPSFGGNFGARNTGSSTIRKRYKILN